MEYIVLTNKNIKASLRIEDEEEYYKYLDELVEEQKNVLKRKGIDDVYGKKYRIAFLSDTTNPKYLTIDDAIEMLSIKEGADLVKFKDGTIGFVAYYGSRDPMKNGFKIIGNIAKEG